MKGRELNKIDNKGITLIALVITIVLLLILTAVTVDLFVNDKVADNAEELVNSVKDQQDEQQSLSNMVRNLYK